MLLERVLIETKPAELIGWLSAQEGQGHTCPQLSSLLQRSIESIANLENHFALVIYFHGAFWGCMRDLWGWISSQLYLSSISLEYNCWTSLLKTNTNPSICLHIPCKVIGVCVQVIDYQVFWVETDLEHWSFILRLVRFILNSLILFSRHSNSYVYE